MRKLAITGGAVVLLATAFAIAGPLSGIGRESTGEIDLTAEVRASNCAACHARIAESRSPGLIFSHGAHLTVDCTSCHVRAAHEGGQTYSPPMETCFACHGLIHGDSGLIATETCEDCHTPAFELRPAT
ncbi:MAG: hypothetical protein Q8K89_04820, partial [Actinomycetota bacterium]|nr:hypothetical protein [Actinomycetota bacterium]